MSDLFGRQHFDGRHAPKAPVMRCHPKRHGHEKRDNGQQALHTDHKGVPWKKAGAWTPQFTGDSN